jgi:hypothetical protein
MQGKSGLELTFWCFSPSHKLKETCLIDRLAKIGLAFVLLFSLMVLLAVTTIPKNGHPGTLATAGVTTVGRFSHTATLLEGNKVLIAGGMERNGVWLDSGEVYDETTRHFVPTAHMSSPRAGAMAVALPDGRALIAGGTDGSGKNLATAEIFNPQTNTFSLTGTMNAPRAHGVAIFLPRINKVLIAGGVANGDDNQHASAELYDPSTGRFSQTGSMGFPRAYFNAVLLRDGRVLVMGGMSGGEFPNPNLEASAEIYDPAIGRFSPVGPMNITRYKHGAALLPDGKVIVVGGQTGGSYGERLASTEIFDPAKRKFQRGPEMKLPRYKLLNSVSRLKDGRILVAGGADQPEIYDPAANSFTLVSSPKLDGFLFSSATALADGKVLLVNGYGAHPMAGAVRQAWMWEP